MTRIIYDEIKEKFGSYIKCWMSKETKDLDDVFFTNVRSYLSTAKKMANGSQDSIFGVRDFINDFPKTDELRAKIYNYVCRINGEEAQQYAEIHCLALNYSEESKNLNYFEFVALIANHWKKAEDGWKIDLMKMDLAPMNGNLRSEFEKVWYIQDSEKLDNSPRLNCIVGEIDSPWEVIKNCDDILSDEEKIKESMAKYSYGVDQMVFLYCYDAFSDYYGIGGKMTNREGKIQWINTVKNKRVKDRYWAHPIKFKSIEIDGNRAYVKAERPCGQKLKGLEYIWTKENSKYESCCAKMELEYQKENDGVWRLVYSNYYLGLYQTDEYTKEIYGDLV